MSAHVKYLIVANWKMNKTAADAVEFVEEIKPTYGNQADVGVVLCAPYTALGALAPVFEGTNLGLGAQNMHPEASGAYTGEISSTMLRDLYVNHVILGHSERRAYFKETDEFINAKVKTAVKSQLKAILCVGESLEEREAGRTIEVVTNQLQEGLKDVQSKYAGQVVVAYEPVWAIGTGKVATAEQAQEVHAHIRSMLKKQFSAKGARMPILYGGSMKPGNAKELLAQPDINGGLIGGAALKVKSFKDIIKVALELK